MDLGGPLAAPHSSCEWCSNPGREEVGRSNRTPSTLTEKYAPPNLHKHRLSVDAVESVAEIE